VHYLQNNKKHDDYRIKREKIKYSGAENDEAPAKSAALTPIRK